MRRFVCDLRRAAGCFSVIVALSVAIPSRADMPEIQPPIGSSSSAGTLALLARALPTAIETCIELQPILG